MKILLPALTMGLLASTAASAATADGTALVTCVAQGTTGGESTCPVNLVKGNDYELLYGEGEGTVELINPVGAVTISVPGSYDGNFGKEFRAAYTGTYRLRVRDNYYLKGIINTDCRHDAKTRCALPLNKPMSGVSTTSGDDDWFKTPVLRKGQVYTFTLQATDNYYTRLMLLDGTGRVLARAHANGTSSPAVIRYRARANAALFAVSSAGHEYTLTLR